MTVESCILWRTEIFYRDQHLVMFYTLCGEIPFMMLDLNFADLQSRHSMYVSNDTCQLGESSETKLHVAAQYRWSQSNKIQNSHFKHVKCISHLTSNPSPFLPLFSEFSDVRKRIRMWCETQGDPQNFHGVYLLYFAVVLWDQKFLFKPFVCNNLHTSTHTHIFLAITVETRDTLQFTISQIIRF